jgi:hypothetical protein
MLAEAVAHFADVEIAAVLAALAVVCELAAAAHAAINRISILCFIMWPYSEIYSGFYSEIVLDGSVSGVPAHMHPACELARSAVLSARRATAPVRSTWIGIDSCLRARYACHPTGLKSAV